MSRGKPLGLLLRFLCAPETRVEVTVQHTRRRLDYGTFKSSSEQKSRRKSQTKRRLRTFYKRNVCALRTKAGNNKFFSLLEEKL